MDTTTHDSSTTVFTNLSEDCDDSGVICSNLSSLSAASFDLSSPVPSDHHNTSISHQYNQRRKHHERNAQMDALKQEIVELHVRLTSAAQSEIKQQYSKQRHDNETEYLRKSCVWYKAKLNTSRTENSTLIRNLLNAQRLASQVPELQAQLQRRSVEIEQLRRQSRADYSALSDKVNALEREVILSRMRSQLLENGIVTSVTPSRPDATIIAELQSLQTKYTHIDRRHSELIRDKVHVDAQVEQLQIFLAQSEDRHALYRKRCDQLNAELTASQSQNAILQGTVCSLRAERISSEAAMRTQLEDTMLRMRNMTQAQPKPARARWRSQINTAMKRIDQLRSDALKNERLLVSLQPLAQENAVLQRLLRVKEVELKHKINRYEASNRALLSTVRAHRQGKNRLQDELSRYRTRCEELGVDNSSLSNKIAKLEQVVAQMQSELLVETNRSLPCNDVDEILALIERNEELNEKTVFRMDNFSSKLRSLQEEVQQLTQTISSKAL